MHNRIAKVIDFTGLKKVDFAKRIGISAPFVSELCTGAKKPSDRTITDICREFGVNELWLRTGAGNMTAAISRDEEIARILSAAIVSNSTTRDRLIRALARLPDEALPMVEQVILDAAKALENEKPE